MPNAQINGFQMYYELHGDGLPILYIHGGHGGAASLIRIPWSAVNLPPGARYILYHRRGVCRSGAPDDGYDLPTFAADAAALLDHLAIGQVAVIGSSAGGPIAQQLALDYPERVMALILIGTSPLLWPDDDITRFVRDLYQVLEDKGSEAAFESRRPELRYWLEPLWRRQEADAHGWSEQYEADQQELDERLQAFPREIVVRYAAAELRLCHAYDSVDLRPRLREIACPTLVIHGKTDATVPVQGGHDLHRGIPKSELVLVDAGHAIIDHPEVRGAIGRFLAKVVAGQSREGEATR